MTQEEKDLLLKDLAARLAYKPIIQFDGEDYDLLALENCEPMFARIIARSYKYSMAEEKLLEEIKPYLRPMSSMTEEEKAEYNLLTPIVEVVFPCDAYPLIDWLNQHHFDYRGLIEKGLALEAKEGMYNKV